jgi:integrase
MPVYYDKAKQRWRFSFNRIVGSQRTRSTKLLPAGWSRNQAEAFDRAETSRLYAIATGLEKPEPTIGKAIELYLDYRVPKLKNGKKTARDLAHLVPYIEGQPMSKLADISRQYAKDHPELSEGTIHNRLAYLKSACRYAWRKHKLTEYDPTGHMEIPKPNNQREVHIPVKRVEKLLGRIKDRETRALFTLAFRTGSRWIKGIHPRKPEDVVRTGHGDVWLTIGVTKNGTPRMKWVHPSARWALKYLPFKYGWQYYYDRFCAAREQEGLQGLTIHDMRHVVGTDIRMRGGSLEDVGAALDHLSHQASARYAHIVPAQIKRVLAGVGTRKMHTSKKTRQKKAA